MLLLFNSASQEEQPPKDILGSALWQWQDASDASTVTIATGVSNWADKSGNGRNFTQGGAGSQPGYTSGVSVDFTTGTPIMPYIGAVGNTYDLYMVVTTLSSNVASRGMNLTAGFNVAPYLNIGTDDLGVENGLFRDSGLNIAVSTKKLIMMRVAATVPTIGVNTDTLSAIPSGTLTSPSPFFLGVAAPWGSVHELVIASENSTSDKTAAMVAYLLAKWSVS